MFASIEIKRAEYGARMRKLSGSLADQRLSGIVLFDPHRVIYYSGFHFVPTERPMAYCLSARGEQALFVPRLELEHAQGEGAMDRVEFYVEYPDEPHPMAVLKRLLDAMGIAGRIGADSDGYPWIFGYQGPSLSELTGAQVIAIGATVEAQMAVKSPAEIELIRESARWSNLAHRLLQRYTRPGAGEMEVSLRASQEATLAMVDTLGSLYRPQSMCFDGAQANYRGQIGRHGAIPHSLTMNTIFQPGDVLVTGAAATMWGYQAELERTMVLGVPSNEVRHYFEHMVAAQEVAFDAIRPGVRCCDVERAVRDYYEANRLMPYWKHHTGHGIGLRYHEAPFFDLGDATILQPGMVMTVEPGLYVSGLGGFRHSDTVVLTDQGIELLTYYARDLDSLTLPV